MIDYTQLKFQWYQNGIKTIKPSGEITLEQFVNAIREPKPTMIQAFKAIEEASKAGNKALKDQLKTKHLFFTTPSVYIRGIRNYESVDHFLPFCVCEYDSIPYAEELRDYIFEKMPSCIFAFTSPSKSGCKFIFLISTPVSILQYKELYFGIAYHLDKFKSLDISNRNCVLPLFNSYDPDAKYRTDAIPWTQRGYKENSFVENESAFEPVESIDPILEKEVVKSIEFLVDRITENAHPQILGCSFLIGGWCGGNFISEDLAYDTLVEAIRNNNYMSKSTDNYITTARTMFKKGLNFPAEYTNGRK